MRKNVVGFRRQAQHELRCKNGALRQHDSSFLPPAIRHAPSSPAVERTQIQGVMQGLRCLRTIRLGQRKIGKGGKKSWRLEEKQSRGSPGELPLSHVVLERELNIHVAINTLICAKKSTNIAVAIRAVSPWAGHSFIAFCINNLSGWLSINTFWLSPMRASVSVTV